MVNWDSSYVEDDEPDPPLWPPLLALAVCLAIPVCAYLWVTGGWK